MDTEPKELTQEIVKTNPATFHFRYLSDPQFQSSPIKDGLLELKIPEQTIETATKAIEDLKIARPITISSLIPQPEEIGFIIPTLGIGGRTFSPTEIKLYFDPDNPNVINSLKHFRNPQIAHELVHIARGQAELKNETLLDKIINEGLATYYEEMWGKQISTPWGNNLNAEQSVAEWKSAQAQLDLPVSEDWFFGKDGKHILWSGYTLGNAIIRSYFERHTDQQMSDVAKINSRKILNESGYSPQLKP